MCGGSLPKTTEQFIEEARAIHGDTYDYSLSEYKNQKTKVKIKHTNHIFEQRPYDHVSGHGCPYCFGDLPKTTEQFIKEAHAVHGGTYDYSSTIYVNNNTDVNIICKKGHIFTQRPSNHLHGVGCPICSKKAQKTTEQFIKEARTVHGDTYDYSSTQYTNAYTPVTILCSKHGVFTQRPSHHLQNHGCPFCHHRSSRNELEWLRMNGITDENRQVTLKLSQMTVKVDGYDPHTKTVYEYYGDYWHGNPLVYSRNDINQRNKKTFGELYDNTIKKEQMLQKHGYTVISIWETEYKMRLNTHYTKLPNDSR
jgi:hypothetical protein